MPLNSVGQARHARSLRAILLMGATATGKTRLSVILSEALARRGQPVEIISVDSVQVYEGMDIGSAKPSVSERGGIPHHLIDICDPADAYSAARFCQDALGKIEEIQSRGKLPLLTGGTMLYFRALTQGLSHMPAADADLRRQLSARALETGWPSMHEQLLRLDPETASRLHPNDGQRIQRALEVFLTTGDSISQLHARSRAAPGGVNYLQLAIRPPDRPELHQRIEQRLRGMFKAGFLDEVETLYRRGDLSENLPAIRSVGYRQIWAYFAGKCDIDHAKEATLVATRQFAKRQCTWLRSEHDICWLNFSDEPLVDAAQEQIEAWLDAPA